MEKILRERGMLLADDANQERLVRLAKMFGLTHELSLEPAGHGLSRVKQGAPYPEGSLYSRYANLCEAYVDFNGDVNIGYFGKGLMRARQVEGLISFETGLTNILNRLLIRDFGATDYGLERIASSITSPADFRVNTRTRLTYVPDVTSVTEDQAVPEIGPMPQIVDPESVTYSVGEYEDRFTLTRRALLNDDIGFIERSCAQLGRAAWRTLARAVWGLLINNTPYGADAVPIFNAAHGNLGTTALGGLALTTARQALGAQKEPNGPDFLGLGRGPLLLAVPVSLEETARKLNTAQFVLEDASTPNPWIGKFGEHCENVFTNPFFTDHSWYAFDVSGKVQLIEVGFLRGKQNPEFVQESPLSGGAFTQDRTIYKIRHDWGCAVLDYRGMYKSVVA